MKNFELKLSFFVVLFLAVVYIGYEAVAIPDGGHPFGHALGILGAILMIMAETLYSLRKRTRLINFGRMRHWLAFHIFTGIVGPALVLMHTGLEFRGLAGLTTALTAMVVASGFLGRYIYTAVPRAMSGVEMDRRSMEAQSERQRQELHAWSVGKSARIRQLVQKETSTRSSDLSPTAVLLHRYRERQEKRRLKTAVRQLNKEEQARMREVERLLRRQQRLARQIRSLQTVRRMMGWWHMAHVPLGLTLFTAMTIHIVAVIYYGAFS